jgi:hypothetical protein
MADYVTGPWEVDVSLNDGGHSPGGNGYSSSASIPKPHVTGEKYSSEIPLLTNQQSDAISERHPFVAGLHTARGVSTSQERLIHEVLRFVDPSAAAEIGEAMQRGDQAYAPVTQVRRVPRDGSGRTRRCADGPDRPVGAHPPVTPRDYPVDQDALAVYEGRGALHFQHDPVLRVAAMTDAGVDLVANGKDVVFQARDDAAAARMVEAVAAGMAEDATPADPVEALPGSRCFGLLDGRMSYCVAAADRYVVEATEPRLLDTQRLVAAQAAMLLAK